MALWNSVTRSGADDDIEGDFGANNDTIKTFF